MKILFAVVFSISVTFASGVEAQSTRKESTPTEPEILQSVQHKGTSAEPRKGTFQKVGDFQIETVLKPAGLRLFVSDSKGQPLKLSGVRGIATLRIESVAKRYRYDLFPETGRKAAADSLAVAANLSRIAGKDVEVSYQLIGLQGTGKKPLQFTMRVEVPRTKAQLAAAAIKKQKICPVSEQPLGSMGKPILVTVGKQSVYVCCDGCINAVKKTPKKYLATKPALIP